MNKRLPLTIAGIIFGIVSLLHLLRLFYHLEIRVDEVVVPFWVSTVGFLIALVLSFWMLAASRK